jgi:hypothetical protein
MSASPAHILKRKDDATFNAFGVAKTVMLEVFAGLPTT